MLKQKRIKWKKEFALTFKNAEYIFKHKQIFNNKFRKWINQISWIVFIFQEVCFQKFKKFKEKS
jgi:hypothetical protein